MSGIVIPVSELEGALLDAWVAVCEGNRIAVSAMIAIERGFLIETPTQRSATCPPYSSNWDHGRPVIATRGISFRCLGSNHWEAHGEKRCGEHRTGAQIGPTPLIAGMRCRVSLVMGQTVPHSFPSGYLSATT